MLLTCLLVLCLNNFLESSERKGISIGLDREFLIGIP